MLTAKVHREVDRKKSNISIIGIDEGEQWNEIVKGFKNYDVYYLLEYVKAFRLHGDGEPLLIYYEAEEIKAINLVMKRDISLDKSFLGRIPSKTYYDISTPYGYGGFLLEGNISSESLKSLEEEYKSRCEKEGIICEFVRFHPVLNNARYFEGFYDVSELGETVTVDLEYRNQIWENFDGKNRNMIRKAAKSGVEIFWGRNSELINEFMNLYNATMDKDNASNYYYFEKEFYCSVLNDLKYNSLIFYAMYEERIISMAMVLYSNDQLHYHLSASDRNYQHLAPTNLLLYEAACWGSENGYKTFHLGGGLGSKEDSLYKFKKVFNKKSDTTFKIGRKIFSEEMYHKMISLRKVELPSGSNIGYFPEYRG